MILNENEAKVCLEYALKPILKTYSVEIKESSLWIRDKIILRAAILYQGNPLDSDAEFMLSYQNGKLCFENIKGKVEYLFLQLKLISVLKQMIHDPRLIYQDNACYYVFDLPIEHISVSEGYIEIELKK